MQILKDTVNEYITESPNHISCDGLYQKITLTEDNLNGFLSYMDTFDALKDDWNEWFQLARDEFSACVKCRANNLEEINENLDRIQVYCF